MKQSQFLDELKKVWVQLEELRLIAKRELGRLNESFQLDQIPTRKYLHMQRRWLDVLQTLVESLEEVEGQIIEASKQNITEGVLH